MDLLSSIYTKKEMTFWIVVWFLTYLLCLQRGGADIFDNRTPDNTGAFCQAYAQGDL
jgi:hypothetical protein